MAGHNGPTTAIYVATDDRCNEIKSAMRLYRGEVRIGSKTGLGDDPMYMSDLAGMLMTEGSGVDVVIFDEQSMSEALHGHQAAMKAIVQILRQGLSKFVMVRVIDEGNVITQNGEGILQKGGAIVLKGLDELGGPWARRFADLVDNGILDHQDPGIIMPVMAGGENDRARRDGIDLVVNDDPFAQFAGRPDDPFAGIGRSDTTEEDEEAEAEWDDDPFRNAQTRETPAVSMNDFLGEYAPDQAMSEEELDRIAEDKRWAEYYDQHGVRPDLQKLARLSIEPEPAWSYEEINLALGQRGSSLFKSRQGRANMGLVKSEMLVNSRYIKTYAETHGVPYSAPTECKIISTYSATGGTGKTTVAGMIGVQLNWYFNQSVMQHRSTSWVARILVLSLNEFDDLSVKGIGYNNPMGGAADRKNVAELLRRIDECGGDPDWDDIADCFAASTDNYVYYLPSMTLKDRLDLGVEVSADDYKEIIRVCSKFFGFIVLDMPDIMYDHKDGLVEFALNNAHIVVYIMEPNTKSTFILYQLLEGLLDEEGNSIITPDKWMLVLNKYAKADSPYLGYIDDPENYGQVRFEDIADAVKHHFFAIKAIPLTSRRASGSILFGRDPHVKTAARDITDALLEKIDDNDAKQATKRDRRAGLR